MNTGAHDAGGGFTQSVGTNAARGVAVILAAVLVGGLLMLLGYNDSTVVADSGDSALVSDDDGSGDDGSGDDGSGDDSASGDDGTTTTTTESTTTTAAPAPVARPPAEVTAVVMNATVNKPGIAGRTSELVEQAGYVVLDASNSGEDQNTAIQYAEGYEADAVAVAEVFGLDASVVEPFPAELNVRDAADVEGAQVIVFVGLDGKIDP